MPKRTALEELKIGDYVIYANGYKCELGRIISNDPIQQNMKVCYHGGCTAATTNYADLILLENQACITDTTFGYFTFDPGCPDYEMCPYPHSICNPCR